MKENQFQAKVIARLEKTFPGCVVLKNDPGYRQGIPDLILLWNDRWAGIEVKKSRHEKYQPNQKYYVEYLNRLSYAAVIYPENEEEVFYALQIALGFTG